MNQKNLEVLVNIIAGVENGGQVYGRKKYSAYAPPYHSTPKEFTITLGYWAAYGHEARNLMQTIFDADPAAFRKLDTCSPTIESMLKKDWVSIKWNPSSKQKAVIINIIDSKVGHECQDKIFAEKCKAMVDQCVELYPKADIKAQMMFAEIKHLGGLGPVKRIFNRCNGNYSLDNIMASLVADQKDTSNNNQVGDKIFWSRHVKCRQYIDQYAVAEDDSKKTTTTTTTKKTTTTTTTTKKQEVVITEKTITICGHGSGNPSLKRMDQYLSSRYNQIASNGKHKGVVAVRRLKALDDDGRKRFHDKYKTILGRNIYSQTYRNYCYKPRSNGKYYSDCSSSVCLTFANIGYDCPTFNTVGIYQSDKYFETVPVKISKGHILNPEILKVGDCILFAGNDSSRPLQIGHVEGVYEINGTTPSGGGGSSASVSATVNAFQKFINSEYVEKRNIVQNALKVDGIYGEATRAAAITIWKYMANKYYEAHLTLGNTNFFERCVAVAAKMDDAEIEKHPTLGILLQGLLAGNGLYSGNLDGKIGTKTKEALKKLGYDTVTAAAWSKLYN